MFNASPLSSCAKKTLPHAISLMETNDEIYEPLFVPKFHRTLLLIGIDCPGRGRWECGRGGIAKTLEIRTDAPKLNLTSRRATSTGFLRSLFPHPRPLFLFRGQFSDGSCNMAKSREIQRSFYRRARRDKRGRKEDLGMLGYNSAPPFCCGQIVFENFSPVPCSLSRALFVFAIVRQDFQRARVQRKNIPPFCESSQTPMIRDVKAAEYVW